MQFIKTNQQKTTIKQQPKNYTQKNPSRAYSLLHVFTNTWRQKTKTKFAERRLRHGGRKEKISNDTFLKNIKQNKTTY